MTKYEIILSLLFVPGSPADDINLLPQAKGSSLGKVHAVYFFCSG